MYAQSEISADEFRMMLQEWIAQRRGGAESWERARVQDSPDR
jgi:hypothetical protein